MNLHLSTKRKPIESSEILSGTRYFQFQGASFSSSSKGFVKNKALYYTFVPMEKGESTSFLSLTQEPFSENFGHWKVSSERGVLWGSSKTLEASRLLGPRNIPNQTRATGNPGIPTCQPVGFKEHTSCRKMSWREGMSIRETETASSGGDLLKVMKSNIIIEHSCQIDELWIRCIFDMHMDGKWNWHTTGMELGTMCFWPLLYWGYKPCIQYTN